MSMPTEPAAAFAVDALRAIAQRCGGDAARQKRELLAQCARAFEARRERPPDARTLVAYHDLLLFVIAYPDSAELALAAQRELRRVASMARRIAQHGSDRQRERLAGSGTAWSTVTAAFSLSIAHWLVRRHPNCADVDSFGEGGTALADVLRLALPSIDHEALDAATGDPMALLEELAGARSGGLLAWLTRAVDSIEADADVRDHLFDSLRAYVRIEPQRTNLSRTTRRRVTSCSRTACRWATAAGSLSLRCARRASTSSRPSAVENRRCCSRTCFACSGTDSASNDS